MGQAKEAVKRAAKLNEEELAKQVVPLLIQLGLDPTVQEKNTILLHHNDQAFTLQIMHSIRVSKIDRTAIMDLLEENMRAMYERSSAGWNRREKQRELFDKAGRFLILKSAEDQVTAFVNWRFDCEDCEPEDSQARSDEDVVEVLYCYEVQIQAAYRARRLGRILMELLHAIAAQSRMRKTMLTVFLFNESARRFYAHIGYFSDLISPVRPEVNDNNTNTEDQPSVDYDILSRVVD